MLSATAAPAVAADPAGNIYVVGTNEGWVDLDPGPGQAWINKTSSSGNWDAFLAKYGPDKTLQWVKPFSGGQGRTLRDVAVGPDGSIYVAGGFTGSATFGNLPLTSATTTSFVAKLAPEDGNIAWTMQFSEASGYNYGWQIALDGQGKVYLAGKFQGTVDFMPGVGTLMLTAGNPSGGSDGYVVQLTDNGTSASVGWATQLGTTGAIDPWALAADATGVYAGGRFMTDISLPGFPGFPGFTDLDSYAEGYLVKLNAGDGGFAWAEHYTSFGYPYGVVDLATDGAFVYVVGDYCLSYPNNRAFIARYAADGSAGWFTPFSDLHCYGVVAAGGMLYVTGCFAGTVDFDPDPNAQFPLSSPWDPTGAYPVNSDFILKMTGAGDFLWAGQMAQTSPPGQITSRDDNGKPLAVDGTGNVVIAGQFHGTGDFDPAGDVMMTALGSSDEFVSRLVPVDPLSESLKSGWVFQLGTYDRTIDDGDLDYQEWGSGWKSAGWKQGYQNAYLNDYRYHAKGTGANKAQWTFTGLPAGQYEVYATWATQTGNATNAQYVINGVNAPLVNQQVAPNGRLGLYTADSLGKMTVVLSDKANGTIVADSIRVLMHWPAAIPEPPAPAKISISDVSASEGNSGTTVFQFTVTLSAPATSPIVVTYNTQAGTATGGVDFQLTSGTLTFIEGGPLSQQITVTVYGDATKEANETFFVNLALTLGDATLAKGQGTGTIVNDDGGKP